MYLTFNWGRSRSITSGLAYRLGVGAGKVVEVAAAVGLVVGGTAELEQEGDVEMDREEDDEGE